jgi:hypothetical protein
MIDQHQLAFTGGVLKSLLIIWRYTNILTHSSAQGINKRLMFIFKAHQAKKAALV